MNLGFIRQYLGEVPPDRTFTAKELWEVFNAFAPLMTKEQEKKMVDNLKNLLETHTVKEGGYENEPCYQRECSNPSKHTNGLHIGSEREVKEEPTTPEKNRDWQSDREDYRNGKPLDKPMSYEVTCGRCEKSIKHSCGRV